MPKGEGWIAGWAKQFARWAGVPLAEDALGAMVTTVTEQSDAAPTQSDAEDGLDAARAAFARWKNVDPFPSIAPALLNTADIDDYARTTAMVFPYDPEKRKTASYAIRVGMEVAYWDPNKSDEAPIRSLDNGDRIVIPSNSLIYVRTHERFLLPNYMAVRFNLHIDLVHKGLLLGTGPLVDPGFEGRLMVPLHNLTSNDYVLAVGDDFIWAEFTKTSLTETWTGACSERPERSGELKPFPDRKANQSIADYIEKAKLGHSKLQPGLSYKALQNSIPVVIDDARKTAQKAQKSAGEAERFAKHMRNLGILAFLGATAGITSIFISNNSTINTTLGLVNGTNAALEKQAERIKDLEVTVDQLRQQQQLSPTPTPTPTAVARPK